MPQDVKATIGETPDGTESSPSTYTREDVEAIVAEQRAEWQKRFTKATQELAAERRAKGELSQRLSAVEARLMQTPAAHEDADDLDEDAFRQEWDSIDSGEKLLRANRRLIRHELRKSGADQSDAEIAQEALRRAEELALDRDVERLKSKYRGMTDEQVKSLYELGVNTGQTDIEYLAFQAFGPAESFTPDTGDDGPEPDIEKAIRARTKHRVLAGASKVTTANAQPKTVKIRRGLDGYTDVENAAQDFFKGR